MYGEECGTIYSCVLRSVKFNDMFHDSRISKIDIFLVLTIWMNAPDPLKNLGEKREKLYICSSSRQFDKKIRSKNLTGSYSWHCTGSTLEYIYPLTCGGNSTLFYSKNRHIAHRHRLVSFYCNPQVQS